MEKTEHVYEVNDWAYYEFELYQILKIREGRLTLTDGLVDISNIRPSECWPATIDVKIISDECKSLYTKIREAARNTNINYPGIRQTLANYFNTICGFHDDPIQQNLAWQRARDFTREVVEKLHVIHEFYVCGVPILKK